MAEKRLNNCLLLHAHKDLLNLEDITKILLMFSKNVILDIVGSNFSSYVH